MATSRSGPPEKTAAFESRATAVQHRRFGDSSIGRSHQTLAPVLSAQSPRRVRL